MEPILYYSDIRDCEIKLTKEEEWALIAKAQSGCSISTNKVFQANSRFVIQQAKLRLMNNLLPDLIQAGNIGLLNAIKKFDVKRKVKFISFAVYHIRAEINLFLTINYRTIRLPSNVCQDIASGKISRENYTSTTSLTDFTVESELENYFEQPTEFDFSKKEIIEKILSCLSEKQKRIFKYKMGFDGREPLSVPEISVMLGESGQNIRLHLKNSATKIKKKYPKEQLIKILYG